MAGNQRGNTILISAILVLALTVAALTISRLLAAQTNARSATGQFLGPQANALCLSGLEAFAGTPSDGPLVSYSFAMPRAATAGPDASFSTAIVALSVQASSGGPLPAPATFSVLATTSIAGVDAGATVSAQLQATVSCAGLPPPPCTYTLAGQ